MDNSSNFLLAFNFVKYLFVKVFSTLDTIKIFGSFSVLDFNIALLLLGAILPIVIVTVKNWSGNAHAYNVSERRHNELLEQRDTQHMRSYLQRQRYYDSKN